MRKVDIYECTEDIYVCTVEVFVHTADIYVCVVDICVLTDNDLARKCLHRTKLTFVITNHDFFSLTPVVTNFISLYVTSLLAT